MSAKVTLVGADSEDVVCSGGQVTAWEQRENKLMFMFI